MKLKQRTLFALTLSIECFLTAAGCRGTAQPADEQKIVGRWAVVSNVGVNVPHSFFWFSMDYVEIRADGTLLGLMAWPPGEGEELRLNQSAVYRLLDDGRLEISGSCRHENLCRGQYDLLWEGGRLLLSEGSAVLELLLAGPVTEGTIPAVPGPVPSPTPVKVGRSYTLSSLGKM